MSDTVCKDAGSTNTVQPQRLHLKAIQATCYNVCNQQANFRLRLNLLQGILRSGFGRPPVL